MFSISKNPQASMAEVLAKAEKYINGEEALRDPKRKIENDLQKRRGNLRDRLSPPQFERRRRYSPQWFTTLTASVSLVLREVQNEQFLRWLTQMKSNPTTRDNSKYCEFHRDYGHRTDDFIQLKRKIEYLIRHGYL